jgi:hypothetical protein
MGVIPQEPPPGGGAGVGVGVGEGVGGLTMTVACRSIVPPQPVTVSV